MYRQHKHGKQCYSYIHMKIPKVPFDLTAYDPLAPSTQVPSKTHMHTTFQKLPHYIPIPDQNS